MRKEEFLSRIARINEEGSLDTIEEANTLEGFIFPLESLEYSQTKRGAAVL
jgi:hypothetical protein